MDVRNSHEFLCDKKDKNIHMLPQSVATEKKSPTTYGKSLFSKRLKSGDPVQKKDDIGINIKNIDSKK